MSRAIALLAAVVLMVMALPASAHSDEELAEWQDSWEQRVEERGGTLSIKLVAEMLDMKERHPCREVIDTPCAPVDNTGHAVSTSPSTSTSSAPSGNTGMGSGNVEQWRSLVESYFGEYTDEALRVIACESGGNTNAKNPTSSASGLFQVLGGWADKFGYSRSDLFVPEINVSIAKILFDDGASRGNRWSHWVCKP